MSELLSIILVYRGGTTNGMQVLRVMHSWLKTGESNYEFLVVNAGDSAFSSIELTVSDGPRISAVTEVPDGREGDGIRTGVLATGGAFVLIVDSAFDFSTSAAEEVLKHLHADDAGAAVCAGRYGAGLKTGVIRVGKDTIDRIIRKESQDSWHGIAGFQGDLVRRAALYSRMEGLEIVGELLTMIRLWKRAVIRVQHSKRGTGTPGHFSNERSFSSWIDVVRIRRNLRKGYYPVTVPSLEQEASICPVDWHKSTRLLALVDDHYRFCICRRCKSIYQDPRLILPAITDQYRKTYYSTDTPRSGYIDYQRTLSQQTKTAGWVWDRIQSLIIEPVYRVLDVGCGSGVLLKEARLRGMEGWGNDLNNMIDDEEVSFIQGDFLSVTLEGKFDAVIFKDSLEHFPDPYTPLRRAHALLNRNGLLVINTPDANSWLRYISGRRWIALKHEHLFLLTRKNMAGILSKTGFKLEHRLSSRRYVDCAYLEPRRHLLSPFLARLFGPFSRMMGDRPFLMPTGDMLVLASRVDSEC